MRTALYRDLFLITDKHTEILDCIRCFMAIFLSTWQAGPYYVIKWEMEKTNWALFSCQVIQAYFAG